MVQISVDGRVRVPLSEIREEEAASIRKAFTYPNPSAGKPRHEGEPSFYRTWSHDEAGNLTVPRGGLEKVESILGGRNPGSVRDLRTWSHPEPDFPDHRKEPRDYQVEMMDAADAHDHGILRASTGSGKTTTAFGMLARWKRRSLVMVCSGALLKQWRERAIEELGIAPEDVGHIQGDREIIRPLTLAMQQTIASRFADRGSGELMDAFDVFIMDEVQRSPAATCVAAIDPFTARKRFGISADHSRHDGLEFIATDLFGPVICSIDPARVVASGATVEVEIACVPTKFQAPWYRYRQDFNKLLHQMTNDDGRNAQILSLVRSAVASGEQVIVFTHRVEHARYLDGQVAKMGIPGGLMLGGKPEEKEFDRTKMRLKAGQIRVAVGTYAAIGEGIDVPSVARGIGCTPMHNNRQKVNQVMGRICRGSAGKTGGRLAYLFDPGIYGRKPVVNFEAWFPSVKVWSEADRRWLEARDWLGRRAA